MSLWVWWERVNRNNYMNFSLFIKNPGVEIHFEGQKFADLQGSKSVILMVLKYWILPVGK